MSGKQRPASCRVNCTTLATIFVQLDFTINLCLLLDTRGEETNPLLDLVPLITHKLSVRRIISSLTDDLIQKKILFLTISIQYLSFLPPPPLLFIAITRQSIVPNYILFIPIFCKNFPSQKISSSNSILKQFKRTEEQKNLCSVHYYTIYILYYRNHEQQEREREKILPSSFHPRLRRINFENSLLTTRNNKE